MIVQLKRIILFVLIICLPCQAVFSQSHVSRNNYTGNWETSTSWSPPWVAPQTNIFGYDITINGYVTVNGSISFSFLPSNLIINDTLVIYGDLTLGTFTNLTVNGILIVRGKLTIGDFSNIITNNYIIITGDVLKLGSTNTGSFISNNNPVKVFIGGRISPSSLYINKTNFRALNCPDALTTPYPNSTCSYGNMTDIANDPIYPFFQSTCTIAPPSITAGGPTTFCTGGSVTLTSSSGSSYLWSNGATTPSVNITASGSYTVKVTNSGGCQSAASVATIITVNPLPSTPVVTANGPTTFCDGGNVTLTSSAEAGYFWSNSATSPSIRVTTAGNYSVQVTNSSGCQSASSLATIVTINEPPGVPTITAQGPTSFCEGDTVTLKSSAGSSYLWSNGETLPNIAITTAGSYTVKVANESGCLSAASGPVVTVVNLLPVLSLGNNGPVCEGSSLTLTGGPAGMRVYFWSGPGEFSSSSQNPPVTDSATFEMAGTYALTVATNNGCIGTAKQNIVINTAPEAVAGPDQELKSTFETQMNAILSSSETGEWSQISGSGKIDDIHSPTARITDLSIGENKFLWKVLNGNCEDTAEVKITVFNLFVPSVITPNGDGKNDNFRISEFSGKVEMIIFNRWGNEEYRSGNYLNDWNGRNNKGTKLPEDTYFYILKFENGKIVKGSVLIKR